MICDATDCSCGDRNQLENRVVSISNINSIAAGLDEETALSINFRFRTQMVNLPRSASPLRIARDCIADRLMNPVRDRPYRYSSADSASSAKTRYGYTGFVSAFSSVSWSSLAMSWASESMKHPVFRARKYVK